MMTLESSVVFIISLILLWIKPGPGQTFKITRALNDGFFSAFYVSLGIISGCLIFFLVAALGSKMLTTFFNDISIFLKIIGASYLFYSGFKTLNNLKKGLWIGAKEKTYKRKFIENYPAGLILTLGNPLPIFFFLGLLPTFVPVGEMTLKEIIIGLSIITLIGLVVDSLLILLVSQVKDALSDKKFVKAINSVTGIGFILIGLLLVYSIFFEESFRFDLL